MRLVVYHCRGCDTSITKKRDADKHANRTGHTVERHEWVDCACDLCALYGKLQESRKEK